jgi:ParB family chromosome partitioning protein
MPREFIFERILPALEVAQRSDAIEAWGKMLAAGEALLKATASGEVAERAGIEISNWGDAEMSEILAVLKELRCSASIQMEVIERIREIALIQDRSRLAVLQQPEVQAVLKSRHSNHRQKTEALRMLLSRWRFPRLSARKESFIHQWNEASLPRAIRLSPPPDFEGGRWQLELAFGSQQELKELLELALDFAVSPVMARILSGENS